MPLYNLQSTTMPLLSLNTHGLSTGPMNSYTAGLGASGSGIPIPPPPPPPPPPTLSSSLLHPSLTGILDHSALFGGPSVAALAAAFGPGPGVGGLPGTSSLYGLGGGGIMGCLGGSGGGLGSGGVGVGGMGLGGIGGLSGTYVGGPTSFIDAGSSASYPFTTSALRGAAKLKLLDEMDLPPLTRYGANRSSPCSPIPPGTWALDDFADSISASMLQNRCGLALGALDLDSMYY